MEVRRRLPLLVSINLDSSIDPVARLYWRSSKIHVSGKGRHTGFRSTELAIGFFMSFVNMSAIEHGVQGTKDMAIKVSRVLFTIALALLSSSMAWAQHDQQARVLTVDGHPGKAEVIQNNGRPYVDLESLVEITRGSLSYREGRI